MKVSINQKVKEYVDSREGETFQEIADDLGIGRSTLFSYCKEGNDVPGSILEKMGLVRGNYKKF
jgi:hypothetical protein